MSIINEWAETETLFGLRLNVKGFWFCTIKPSEKGTKQFDGITFEWNKDSGLC